MELSASREAKCSELDNDAHSGFFPASDLTGK